MAVQAERAEQWLSAVGRQGERVLRSAGALGMLVWRSAVSTATGKVPLRSIIEQASTMGVRSLPLVLLTGMLAGIVTTQQGGYQLSSALPMYVIGSVVTSSVILELGPIMTAFVLIGRVGARITAELGTMRVSEQVDALLSLGRDPVRELVAPRLIAGMLTTPALVLFSDLAGVLAGAVAAQASLGLGTETFLYGARLFWHNWDLFYSVMKGLVFGFIIPLISCHIGLSTDGGAAGVGKSTTTAVVGMIVAILVLDAMFPPLLLN